MSHEIRTRSVFCRLPRGQGGAVLIIALVVLVAMTLSALALIRSVSTTNLVSGNMAFRESAVLSAEHGTEKALAVISTRVASGLASLFSDDDSIGYRAARRDPDPAAGENWAMFWDTGSPLHVPAAGVATDPAGNTVSFIIHRLCQTTGRPADANCARPPLAGTDDSHAGGGMPLPSSSQIYYRITSRVQGPRNTVAYTQTIIAI